MAASETELREVLKPFYQRASEVEDRLSRLEIAAASKTDAGNEELLKTISELQLKLEGANAETALERERAEKLAVENVKLQYRISHLAGQLRKVMQNWRAWKVLQQQVNRQLHSCVISNYELRIDRILLVLDVKNNFVVR